MKRIFIIIIIFCIPIFATAQGDKKKMGEEQVNVVKPFQPTLSDGYKISNQAEIEQTPKDPPRMNYSVNAVKLPTVYEVATIQSVKIKDETVPKLYHYLVKLGYGNYDMPLGELYLNSTRSKEYAAGAYLKHLSSGGKLPNVGPAGWSDNEMKAWGERYINKETISANMDYLRNNFHFYGYNPDSIDVPKNQSKQTFNYFKLGGGIKSHFSDKSMITHDINLSYSHFEDRFQANENTVVFDANAQKNLSDKQWIKLNLNLDNTAGSMGNFVGGITPMFGFKQDAVTIEVGGRAELENINGLSSKIHFYPIAELTAKLAGDFLKAYAGVDGKIIKNTFKTLSDENPYLNSNLTTGIYSDPKRPSYNTNNKKSIHLGIRGNLSNEITFNLRGKYSEIESEAFYINSWRIPGMYRYVTIYDNPTVTNIHLEIAYIKTEKLRLELQGDYYHYIMSNELEPWQKPDFTSQFSMRYEVGKKVFLKGEIFLVGNRQTADIDSVNNGFVPGNIFVTESGPKLKPYADVNFGIDYSYTKILHFFMNLNNLGAVKYERWYRYPSQRFNVMAGLTYSF